MILWIILFVLGVVMALVFNSSNIRHSISGPLFGISTILWMAGVILMIISGISHLVSYDTIADSKAFFQKNAYVLKIGEAKYPDAGIAESSEGAVKVKTLGYEYVMAMVKYNKAIIWYRTYQDHWFIDKFVGTMPSELPTLVIHYQPAIHSPAAHN